MRLKEFLTLIEDESAYGVNVRIRLHDKTALQDAAEGSADDKEEAVKLFAEMIDANGSDDVVTLKYNRGTRTFKWVKTR